MVNLTANQWKLLHDLSQLGGVLISQSVSDRPDYDVLERARCVNASALDEFEVRYEMTEVGNARLRDYRVAGQGTN
jgi:hypothetical protein